MEFFYIAGLVFLVFLIWEFLRFILRAHRVNSEVICAGLSIYLLLGLMWMFAYLLVARAVPDAFAFTAGPAAGQSLYPLSTLFTSAFSRQHRRLRRYYPGVELGAGLWR